MFINNGDASRKHENGEVLPPASRRKLSVSMGEVFNFLVPLPSFTVFDDYRMITVKNEGLSHDFVWKAIIE